MGYVGSKAVSPNCGVIQPDTYVLLRARLKAMGTRIECSTVKNIVTIWIGMDVL